MKPTLFPNKLARRREEAKARQAVYDKLSPQAKLAQLDKIFGVGMGAKKERAKLLAALDKACEKK